MDKDIIEMIVTVSAVCIPLFAIAVISIKKSINEHRKQLKELMSETELEPVGIGARVIGKRTELSYKGIKIPEHSIVYIVSFLTDKGETKEYSVTEDIYNSLFEHDTGTLVTINDNFFDFGKGESI